MSHMNPKVDFFFNQAGQWKEEVSRLREIILECHLAEELKWGCPCYQFGKKNVVLIHTFKAYCALLFFKGALLKDPQHILVQQTENVQAARQVRFTSVNEIKKLASTLKAYIYEAVEAEEAGLKVPLKKTKEFAVAEEFQQKLDQDAELKKAFEALTPGRQRAYLLHFAAAKQSKTRIAQIEQCTPQILEGKGLND